MEDFRNSESSLERRIIKSGLSLHTGSNLERVFQTARIAPRLAILHSASQDTRAEIYVPESQKLTKPFSLCSDNAIWQLPLQYHLGCKKSVYLVRVVLSKFLVCPCTPSFAF